MQAKYRSNGPKGRNSPNRHREFIKVGRWSQSGCETALSLSHHSLLTLIFVDRIHKKLDNSKKCATIYIGLTKLLVEMLNHDSTKRSILKTLTWRILASLDTFGIAWIITGSLWAGASIAGIEIVTKLFFYYLHERAWSHVNYGAMSHPDSPAFVERQHLAAERRTKKS